jgi:hypothetical protein
MHKAVAIDLDGTLLNSHSKLSNRSHDTLRQFKDLGGLVVIATGRWREFTVALEQEMPGVVDFLVCNDGGLILQRTSTTKQVILLMVGNRCKLTCPRLLIRPELCPSYAQYLPNPQLVHLQFFQFKDKKLFLHRPTSTGSDCGK